MKCKCEADRGVLCQLCYLRISLELVAEALRKRGAEGYANDTQAIADKLRAELET